jgi:hypothetical protein
MPGCLTLRTVSITSIHSQLAKAPLLLLSGFVSYDKGRDKGPILTLITIHSTPTFICLIFEVTNDLSSPATAIIFLAPISAFDQVNILVLDM